MERTSVFRLFRCWLRNYDSLVPLFLLTKTREDRLSGDLLPEEVIVTHLVTCHGRDHLVNIQSGRHNFVIVNVHLEPELTLRQLRGRLRLIHPHWPAYPNGAGIIWVTSTSVIQKKDDSMSVTDGDPRKTAVFHSFFPHVLEVAQPDYTRRDSTALGIIRALSRIDRIFINLLMVEARDFHCYSHVYENLGKRTIPSDHAAVRVVIQKHLNRGHQSKRIPSWMSKHPIFCSLLQQLHDDHRFSRDPFCALAVFKMLLNKAKKMTSRELSRQTHDCIGAKLFIASTALRVPTEIDILGHSCDVVRHGSLLKTASIRLPLSVLISRDSAKSLRSTLS